MSLHPPVCVAAAGAPPLPPCPVPLWQVLAATTELGAAREALNSALSKSSRKRELLNKAGGAWGSWGLGRLQPGA